ncbi:MAG: hypothetical protein JF616_05550 [Fibrobacteres bacterium]|jgi:hypothetical protein|nr:hypothetical protein [Fibrobacterota bacterium]
MQNKWMANLIASALTLSTVACMQENPMERPSADGKTNDLSVAARSPIGSTEMVQRCSTLAQLRAMTTTGNYLQTKDIDASPTSSVPFVPIGFTKDPFQGTFNGNNHTIDKLTIKGSGENTGMFSWAVNANFQNIRLTNVNVQGGRNTGALAGYVRNVDLTYSYVTGTVTGNLQGDSRLGMVFGRASDFVRVSRCYATGTVNGWGQSVGGFVGYIDAYGIHDPNDEFGASFSEIFTNVTVNPNMPSGTGYVYAGGLAGYVIGGLFNNVHTVGSVTGRKAAGGILGYVVNDDPNSEPSVLRGAMSRGIVTDASVAGRAGTIGMSTGTFGWCGSFWDNNTDGGVPNPLMPEPMCQTGKSSNELKGAHPSPNRVITPYYFGSFVTQQLIDANGWDQCHLGSGSDFDWGFGTCGTTQIWASNSSTEYNTLTRIPNPTVQPK